MEKKDFEGKIGETFTVSLQKGQTVDLKLEKVNPLPKVEGADHVENLREEPFSLIFVGPEDAYLSDNTYDMAVKGGEKEAIFISAFKSEKEKGIFYDAVFT